MHRSLIVVAYHYPPENAIGAARPARFVKYLPSYGWQSLVFTAAKQTGTGNRDVFQIEDRMHPVWEDAVRPEGDLRFQWLGELVARKFLFPGAIALGWGRKAPIAIERIVSTLPQKPLAVFSTFPPMTVHSTGRAVARRLGLPWIADFRDPFVQEPIAVEGRIPQYMQRSLEAKFIADADAVIMNTELSAELYRRRYPRHAAKITTIWNGFDPEDSLSALPIPEGQKRSLRHVGALYGGRTPVPILQAWGRLRNREHLPVREWELSLIGPCDVNPQDREAIARAEAQGWLTLRNQKIPKAEAVRLIQECDGLLLIQPQSSIQVPAKLFEYIAIGRPILALAPRNSSVEWVLERCGIPHVMVYLDDTPDIVDRKLIGYLELPRDPVEPSSWYQENFNGKYQTKQLADILDAVVARRGLSAR
jgi:hypothetical protein